MRNKNIFNNVGLALILAAAMMPLGGCSADLSTGRSPEASALVGTWELTTVSRRGTRTRTLTINDDLTGTYQSRDREMPVTDLKLEGDQLTFKVEMTFGEQTFPLEFKGQLEGTTLKGQFITSRGSSEVTGKRVDAAP